MGVFEEFINILVQLQGWSASLGIEKEAWKKLVDRIITPCISAYFALVTYSWWLLKIAVRTTMDFIILWQRWPSRGLRTACGPYVITRIPLN